MDEQPENAVRVSVTKVKSSIVIPTRTRVKMWWHRRQMRRRYGQGFLDTLDEIERRVERDFLLGQEHNVD